MLVVPERYNHSSVVSVLIKCLFNLRAVTKMIIMELYQLVGGSSGPDDASCIFIGEKTVSSLQNNLAFVREKCCHPTMCLDLIAPN